MDSALKRPLLSVATLHSINLRQERLHKPQGPVHDLHLMTHGRQVLLVLLAVILSIQRANDFSLVSTQIKGLRYRKPFLFKKKWQHLPYIGEVDFISIISIFPTY